MLAEWEPSGGGGAEVVCGGEGRVSLEWFYGSPTGRCTRRWLPTSANRSTAHASGPQAMDRATKAAVAGDNGGFKKKTILKKARQSQTQTHTNNTQHWSEMYGPRIFFSDSERLINCTNSCEGSSTQQQQQEHRHTASNGQFMHNNRYTICPTFFLLLPQHKVFCSQPFWFDP